MSLIDNLKWRYATKKFDATKKIDEQTFNTIKEAIQLAPTSYGLQLFKVLVIEDKTLREKLQAASWGQSQVTDASHLIVFCNHTTVKDTDIEDYIKLKSEIQGIPSEALVPYADFMKSSIGAKSAEEVNTWNSKQTYIALTNLMNVCAELKVDTCPMEGFDPAQYNSILGLTEKGLNAALVATIGYRSEEDGTQHQAKVRKPIEELFETI